MDLDALKARIAEKVWLTKTDDGSFWSHMIAPNMSPDWESEQIADAVIDALREVDLIDEPADDDETV